MSAASTCTPPICCSPPALASVAMDAARVLRRAHCAAASASAACDVVVVAVPLSVLVELPRMTVGCESAISTCRRRGEKDGRGTEVSRSRQRGPCGGACHSR